MSDFTHLHVHSHYSLLDGLGKIRPLVEKTKELGMDSLALTDHGVMYGTIDFIKTCQELAVKPIIGIEAYIAPKGRMNKRGKADTNPRHITLLAKNQVGYHNLIQLSSLSHIEGFYYRPRIDYELLEQYKEGLLVLSGCMNSDISRAIIDKRKADAEQLIKWHIDVIGRDNFYLEVQHHPNITEQTILNEELLKYATKFDLPVVATCDAHYINPDDNEAQDVLVCVQTGKTVQDKDRLCMLGEDFSLKSPAELKEAWKKHPEVITNTQKISDQCQVELEFGANKLPHYPLPKNKTPDEALREFCTRQLKHKYFGPIRNEAKRRLDYELEVIAKTGFASYFLIVADFVNEAKNRGILVGPGRGSAAGSIVAYLINITGLDPLHYNLLFERFLNPARVSMPDIDLDFADDRRDEIIDYVRNKYGRDHVAQIITFGTMAARAAIRDAGRALGYPYGFCDQVAKAVPMFTNFDEALQTSELKEMYETDPQIKRLVDTARKLEGVCRHASTHAAGVVITEEPLTNHVPLQLASTSNNKDKQVITQYAMNDVEALGLLKMDFLGLKNLTIIQNTLKFIKENKNKDIILDKIPLNDPPTYQLLQAGQTTGVFQLESSGMKRYLKELKPTEFEDIISMVALYRPGPMDSLSDFIAAKHGRKKIEYLHPILKPILEKTYGVIVTQDQVLEIAREFASFSYAEADILRKAVGKKIRKLLIEQRVKFIAGAVNNKQIDKLTAEKVWDFIEPFARYGFNRAHAACYAMIAYQTAYLKANYVAEFMAALLTSDEGNTDRQAIEVNEAISLNLKVLPPDINESGHDFTVDKNKENKECIRFGLSAIKNVGHGIVQALIEEREKNGPFKDLFDAFRRINSKDLNKKSVESLARAGAFDSIIERNQVLHNMEKLLELNRTIHRQTDTGQQGLFAGAKNALSLPSVILDKVQPASKDDKLSWEKELLGLYLSEHPFGDLQSAVAEIAVPLADLPAASPGQQIRVAGVITQIKKIITKTQQPMLFVQIEDTITSTEIIVFPTLLNKTGEQWLDGAKILIEGKVSDKDDEIKILADKVWSLTNETLPELILNLKPTSSTRSVSPTLTTATKLSLYLSQNITRDQLEKLRDILQKNNSDTNTALSVELLIPRNGHHQLVTTDIKIPRDQTVTHSIAHIIGENCIRFSR